MRLFPATPKIADTWAKIERENKAHLPHPIAGGCRSFMNITQMMTAARKKLGVSLAGLAEINKV